MFKLTKVNSVLGLASFFYVVNAQAQVDPTRPFGVSLQGKKAPVEGELVLESIIQREVGKVAIVSSKMLKQGDDIGSYTVVMIDENSVTLRSPEKDMKLILFSDVVVDSK